jgi:hypothetical protein
MSFHGGSGKTDSFAAAIEAEAFTKEIAEDAIGDFVYAVTAAASKAGGTGRHQCTCRSVVNREPFQVA